MTRANHPSRIDYLSLGILSATVLAYEIVLLRVFSYSQWHHFASLAISIALLGFGAAGTLLAILGKRAVRMGDALYSVGLLLGAGGMLLGTVLPHFVRSRPLFAVWDPGELGKLLLLDFSAFIPFFGIAICIGQVLMRWPGAIHRLYGVNLLGSGLGALVASCLLGTVFLNTVLLVLPAVVLVAGALHGSVSQRSRWMAACCGLAAAGLGTWSAVGPPTIPISDFKRLSYLMDLPDSRILERHAGLESETTVIRSDSIRLAPGLSLHWADAVPSGDALVVGSDRVIPVPRAAGAVAEVDFHEACLSQLPFKLRPDGEVLLMGTSEWLTPVEVAHRHPVWVESHRGITGVLQQRGLLRDVQVLRDAPRRILAVESGHFSIIYIPVPYCPGDAVSEDYLMTRESLESAIHCLSPDGLLAIPLPLANPPRHAPKLLTTLKQALEGYGVEDPSAHFAFIRSMREALFLVSREPLGPEDLDTIRQFTSRWGFDLAAMPGLSREEANQFHQLGMPLYFDLTLAIFEGNKELPSEADWYSIDEARDAKPYFWRSMRWEKAPALLNQLGRQGLVWMDWALLTTVAKLFFATVLATLFILIPLGKLPKRGFPMTRPRIWLYFSALGLGFLLLEMAVYQRSILFIGTPVLTASLVFSVFLVGAGLGSLSSAARRYHDNPFIIFFSILVSATLVMAFLVAGEPVLWALPMALRPVVMSGVLFPLAWSLGKAFPWGLRQLSEDRTLIAWAWGINGFASVLAAPLATLLSVHFSQYATWGTGAACYCLAWWIAASWRPVSVDRLRPGSHPIRFPGSWPNF